MCLAVPGRIVSVEPPEVEGLEPKAVVDFQGSRVEVSLQVLPGVGLGDWVLVHAGLAIQQLDPAEARETWEYLEAAELVGEMPGELRDETSAKG